MAEVMLGWFMVMALSVFVAAIAVARDSANTKK